MTDDEHITALEDEVNSLTPIVDNQQKQISALQAEVRILKKCLKAGVSIKDRDEIRKIEAQLRKLNQRERSAGQRQAVCRCQICYESSRVGFRGAF